MTRGKRFDASVRHAFVISEEDVEGRRAEGDTAVEKTVFEALPQFGVEASEITKESTFEELDVDSLDLAELSQIIEDEYGVKLKGEDVGKIKTVGDAVDLVVQRAG